MGLIEFIIMLNTSSASQGGGGDELMLDFSNPQNSQYIPIF